MNLFRKVVRGATTLLGHDSPLIAALRPAYNWVLDRSTGGRGIRQTLNGRECFRVDPWHRVHFPESKDPEVCDYLRGRVRPGAVCVNVGAHVGYYALCLAYWSAPAGRVVAFEPNPATRAVLQRHVDLNDLTGCIEVCPEAVSDVPGTAEFFPTGLEGFSRLGQPNPDLPGVSRTPLSVPVTTVDVVCAARNLHPDWLLVDVEGYEIRVLAGARQTLADRRGQIGIVVEMHPNLWHLAGSTAEDLKRLLATLGLRALGITGQVDPLAEYGIVHLYYL